MAFIELLEKSFRDFIAALQTARLYSDWHPQFKKYLEKAYASLQEVLNEKERVVIGIVGEELAFEKEILFELSKFEKPMIIYLKGRGIERIEFSRGLGIEELAKFIAFLTMPKEEIKYEAEKHLSILGIRNIIAGKIKAAALEEEGGKLTSYLSLYEDSMEKVTNTLEGVLNEEEVDRFALRFNVTNIMDNLLGRYQDFLNFGTMKRYDTRTYFHTLNVSLLAMYVSTKMGFTKEQVLDIGTAALFHDIGKIYISRKILTKPAKLSDEEFSKIKNHVTRGVEILLRYIDELGVLPAVICFEHHLKFNLTGYPRVTYPQKPHIASQIVTMCDIYDALTQRRGYKNDYPPLMIYELMSKESGSTFDPVLLSRFFKIIGVWPVGSVVALNDARIAVVREENEDDIMCPKVEIIEPQPAKKELLDLSQEKDKVRIENFLNPFNEGKPYLHFV